MFIETDHPHHGCPMYQPDVMSHVAPLCRALAAHWREVLIIRTAMGKSFFDMTLIAK